ncbi:beta-lactamase family protein [Pseudoalteromonas sp. MMG006]|uniref:serine hydrolase domain-containing protein n=1 Tax=Pseudoalteromonas sp. MMG006 TaxID=2822683 RepID=UPI001B36D679|nr:serine hydrolase domain-containing protein [Pseudoalteromonas sp. MMG006]MBQ4800737.1 beta-lactamase family protein [Pseudoalteromonas sp. MMG006]
MKIINLIFGVFFSFSICAANVENISDLKKSTESKIDAIFAPMNNGSQPGCAVGVFDKGGVVYAKGFGLANLEFEVPITPDTIFDIASTSKQFTATSVLMLNKQGLLSLKDPVRKYIPELPSVTADITIEHLLHHTSGIRDYIRLFWYNKKSISDLVKKEDILKIIVQEQYVDFKSGQKYVYSNSGYFLLALIVERVSGIPFSRFVQQRIFTKLGMDKSAVIEDPRVVIANRANAYKMKKNNAYYKDQSDWYSVGDGGVFTSINEIAKWEKNAFHPITEFTEINQQLLKKGQLNNGKQIRYARGLKHGRYEGYDTIRHNGWWAGYKTQLLRIPELQVSTAVFCNFESANPVRYALEIFDVLFADIYQKAEEDS